MTNDEFRRWRERHFPSRLAAAQALELHRDTVESLETGLTKNGAEYPVRMHIVLACRAVDQGLAPFGRATERGKLAVALRAAAESLEQGT